MRSTASATAVVLVLLGSVCRGEVDLERARALGIRQVAGRHLVLYTDLPADPAVDELPAVFDAAVPQWSAFFDKPPPVSWRMRGSLMKDAAKFRACGLLHEGVPDFANGYSLDDQLWLHEQPSAYYRRHLLLHEGTHVFMTATLGSLGPPWYAEGMAELLGTHRWSDGRLRLGVTPEDKERFAQWGRIKIVADELAAGRGRTLPQVMSYSSRAHRDNAAYGWCWAAASLLSQHPRYRGPLLAMAEHVGLPTSEFNRRFYGLVRGRWRMLEAEWQWYVTHLDYGYDVRREAIQWRAGEAPAAPAGTAVEVDAARGWQSSGLWLEAGRDYRLRAEGRFQVDDEPAPWISEADGVTLRYYDGRPVGLLLAAVHDPSRPVDRLTALCRPQPAGAEAVVRCERPGLLLLRVNESPAELEDNRGSVRVTVAPPAGRPR